MLVCPICACKSFGWAPAATIRAAYVCRGSWKRSGSKLYVHVYPDAFTDVGAQLDELVRGSIERGRVAQGLQDP